MRDQQHGPNPTLSDAGLQALIADALPGDIGFTPIAGFTTDTASDAKTRDVHFSVGCECGASVLLGVEVSVNKTAREINAVMPGMVSELVNQARSFLAKSCDEHTRMRMGPIDDQPG